jgi:hypothetical protein
MDEKNPLIESLVLQVKTRQEIADEYGTCVCTLIRKLTEKNITLPAGHIFPGTLKTIYYALGIPAKIKSKIVS